MTYTAEQLTTAGYTTWTNPRNGEIRIYINDWWAMVGLEITFYKTGNISDATLNGNHISNSSARRIIATKVWWSSIDNELHSRYHEDAYEVIGRDTFWSRIIDSLDRQAATADAKIQRRAGVPVGVITKHGWRDWWHYTCPGCGEQSHPYGSLSGAQDMYLSHRDVCPRRDDHDGQGPDTPTGHDTPDDGTSPAPEQGDPTTIIGTLRAAGRSVREIAAAVGVHTSTVYRWARGLFRPTSSRYAVLVALAA